MNSTEELQQLEITALRSIYAEDFIEGPPPKAWKVCNFYFFAAMEMCDFGLQGAARVPEFSIRVHHPDPEHASKIGFSLNIRYVVLWFARPGSFDLMLCLLAFRRHTLL